MKQETVELITWIKKQINLAKENCIDAARNGKHEQYNADYEKAMNFLDSLPQIESRLKCGGYIADKNNTPCCDGDKVRFKTKVLEGILCGKLQWNPKCARFEILVNAIDSEHFDWTLIMPEIEEFEKI